MLYSKFEPVAFTTILPLFKVGQLAVVGFVGVVPVITGVPQSESAQSISPSPSSSILLLQISEHVGAVKVTELVTLQLLSLIHI